MQALIPQDTFVVMLICMAISFTSSSINRLLISHFVGWEQYRRMQKEIAEYRSQTSVAIRTKDKKLLEKLKKKEPQILSMQAKMAKPQMVLFVISLSYIVVWLFVLPNVLHGVDNVAYIPGVMSIPVIWWYFICSFFFGTIFNRLLGIMPIE
ncbi:MAG: hypothetical protein QXJ11_05645 [Candidatus Bathyarchaeia archaeon]